MGNIGNLANSIYINEFDSTGVTVDSISGWLESSIGKLNNVLYTNFSGSNGQVDGLKLEEESILREMYLYHYYTKQTRNTIRGIANDTNGNILSVRDGEVSKVYKSLAQDASSSLTYLVGKYNSYQASPRQVGGIESVQQPTGSN